MKFIKPAQDPWRTVGGDDGPMVTITPKPDRLLTLVQWHAVRKDWPKDLPVGVTLPNDAELDDLASDLPRFALVALQFPKWTDGRAYSQAHLLRARYRYAGEVRATGEVLVDMLPLLARTGFDAAALRADQDLVAAERALGFFPGHYQGGVGDPLPLFAKPKATIEALTRQPEFTSAGEGI